MKIILIGSLVLTLCDGLRSVQADEVTSCNHMTEIVALYKHAERYPTQAVQDKRLAAIYGTQDKECRAAKQQQKR